MKGRFGALFHFWVQPMKRITYARWLPVLGLCASLAGCGGVSLWPFGSSGEERSRVPPNATEYQCDAGKRFYMRYLRDGASAWIIFPEREFRLDKVASAQGSSRYSNGTAVLEVKGSEATLTDGPTAGFNGCKVASRER